MERRVVITGLGVISPVGNSKEEFWNSLIEGKSGIDFITRFDISNCKSKIGGEIKNFNPEHYLNSKEVRRTDPFTHYAIAATTEAIKDANLEDILNKEGDNKRGICLGTGVGGIRTIEEQKKIFLEKGPDRVSPFGIPALMPNAAIGEISMRYNLRGPHRCVALACASSGGAIGDAYTDIIHNRAELMVTGGSEAALTPFCISEFAQMNALSTRNNEPKKASRPFDKNRDGFVMSEGAAILILECLEHALKRNANIYAEIIGYGLSGDAFHITSPDPTAEGMTIAINNAIEDARISPSLVDYINAHGTSTILNDKTETLAIKKVFNNYAKKIPISSTKSMTGHLIGAASALEAIASILTIKNSIIPPTINYEEPDPDCDLDYVPNTAREKKVNIALSNSFGFGGHNVALIFKRYP